MSKILIRTGSLFGGRREAIAHAETEGWHLATIPGFGVVATTHGEVLWLQKNNSGTTAYWWTLAAEHVPVPA